MTAGGSYSMWNFLQWIRKDVEFVGIINNKKTHSFGVSFFGLGIFKGCSTLLWNHTCNELRFFQNFQDQPRNFSGVFTKAFRQSLGLLINWNRPLIDRQTFSSGFWDTLWWWLVARPLWRHNFIICQGPWLDIRHLIISWWTTINLGSIPMKCQCFYFHTLHTCSLSNGPMFLSILV